MKKFFIFLLIISPLLLEAQQNVSSARAMALGGIGQTISSPAAAFYNQAALARLQTRVNAGIFYRRLLSVPTLSDRSFYFAYKPWQNSAIGIDYYFTGIDVYNSQRVGIAYGMRAAKGLFLGAQVNMHLIHQPSYYGNVYSATADLSMIYSPTENLIIASHVFNFWYGLLNKSFPALAEIAIGYNFSEKAFFTAEIEKQINQPVTWRWGATYFPVKNLNIDFGGYLNNRIYTITFGIGYLYRWVKIDIAFENQPILGFSSGISLEFEF